MKEQRFGIEIEMTGLTREAAARVLSEHLGNPVSRDGGVLRRIFCFGQ
jgi:hypothetical protein